MKSIKIAIVGLSVLFAGFAFVRLIQRGVKSGPAIACEKVVYDFGEVLEGAEVVHNFEIRNVGVSPLSILDIDTSCGCTAAKVDTTEIAPGSSVVLHVTLLTSETRVGTNSQQISVYTNDRRNSRLRLKLTGTIVPRLTINPPKLDFGKVSSLDDSSSPQDVLVSRHPMLSRPVRILNAKSSSPVFKVAVMEEDSATSLQVTMDRTVPWTIGPIAERILLFTDDPVRGKVLISVVADVTN